MDIDDPYVDGLSITYGNSPARKHLWMYAAGASENGNGKALVLVLLEVGHSHFPLWGTITTVNLGLYIQLNNSCTLMTLSGMVMVVPCTGNTCCDSPNLPWFNRKIDTPSTLDIKLRVCRDEVTTKEDV